MFKNIKDFKNELIVVEESTEFPSEIGTSIIGGVVLNEFSKVFMGKSLVSSILPNTSLFISSIASKITLGTIVGGGIFCIGALGVAYKVLLDFTKKRQIELLYQENNEMWSKFFYEIGFYSRSGEIPKLIFDATDESKRVIKFELPNFILTSDVLPHHKKINEFLKTSNSDIVVENDELYIVVPTTEDLTELEINLSQIFDKIKHENNLGEKPTFIRYSENDFCIKAYYSNPGGIHSTLNHDKTQKIISTFSCVDAKMCSTDDGLLELTLFTKALPKVIPYKKFKNTDSSNLQIALGETLAGRFVMDFSDENGHMLIGGESGSGKSGATRVIMTQLCVNYDKKDLVLWLADLKAVELAPFRHSKNCEKFTYSVDETCEMIVELYNEMKRRIELLLTYRNVVNIMSYNKKARFFKGEILNRIVLFIEEINILFQLPNKGKVSILGQDYTYSEVIDKLIEIGRQGRACGIHVFTTTQRPDAKTLDTRLKANLSTRYCLKCVDGTNSEIILGQGDTSASTLRGQGHGIIKNGTGKHELQTYFIDEDEIDDLIYDCLTDEGKRLVDEDRKMFKK